MKISVGGLHKALGAVGGAFILYFLFKNPIFFPILLMFVPGFLLAFFNKFTFFERAALSLPISTIFLLIPNSFSVIGIPINKTIIVASSIVLPLILSFFNFSKFKKEILSLKSSEVCYALFVVGFALFISWFTWGTLLQGNKLPLTDQVVHQSYIRTYKETIENYNRYPYWTSEYSQGFPLKMFDSPVYYERVVLNWMLLPGNATLHMNYYNFFCFFILLIGLYALVRRLGWSKIAALVTITLFMINPVLASKCGYSGDMKEQSSFALLMPLLIVFLLLLKERKLKYAILLGVVVSAYYMTNFVPLIAHGVMMVIFFLLYKIKEKKLFKKELISYGVLVFVVLFFVSFRLIPMALSLEYTTSGRWSFDYRSNFFQQIIKPMFSQPKPMTYTHNMGLWFGIAAVLGMVLSLRKFWSKENYLLLGFWGMLLLYLVPVLNYPMNKVTSHRLIFITLMIFSMFIARIFDLVKGKLKYAVPLLFVFLFVIYTPTTLKQTDAWVNEQAQNGMFQEYYLALDQLGPGRLINYGIFCYATEPIIPVLSEKLWMISHTTAIGARTIPQYELKDGSESALNTDYNMTYIVNRMRTTFTRYVMVIKDPRRKGPQTYQSFKQYLSNDSLVIDNEQAAVFVIPDSNYIEKVVPVSTQLTRKEIYSAPGGWKVHVLNSSDYILESIEQVSEVPKPQPLEYTIVEPGHMEIYGLFKGEWVLVKDHYFPTWHAYQDGKELEIQESNLGILLIKSESGNTITLKHERYGFQKVLAVLPLIMILMIFTPLKDRVEK